MPVKKYRQNWLSLSLKGIRKNSMIERVKNIMCISRPQILPKTFIISSIVKA